MKRPTTIYALTQNIAEVFDVTRDTARVILSIERSRINNTFNFKKANKLVALRKVDVLVCMQQLVDLEFISHYSDDSYIIEMSFNVKFKEALCGSSMKISLSENNQKESKIPKLSPIKSMYASVYKGINAYAHRISTTYPHFTTHQISTLISLYESRLVCKWESNKGLADSLCVKIGFQSRVTKELFDAGHLVRAGNKTGYVFALSDAMFISMFRSFQDVAQRIYMLTRTTKYKDWMADNIAQHLPYSKKDSDLLVQLYLCEDIKAGMSIKDFGVETTLLPALRTRLWSLSDVGSIYKYRTPDPTKYTLTMYTLSQHSFLQIEKAVSYLSKLPKFEEIKNV